MGVTRLPYGLSFVKPGEATADIRLESSATPNVAEGAYFLTAASAITISNFAGGEVGQVIILTSDSNGATTLQNSAGGIVIYSSVGTNSAGFCKVTTGNYVMQDEETKAFVYTGAGWSELGCGVRIP